MEVFIVCLVRQSMTFQFLINESNLKVFPIEICKLKLEFSDEYEREILMKKF